MLRKKLAKRYNLDISKIWSIADRYEDLALLNGFYAGLILSSTENLFLEWLPDSWNIQRISSPLVGFLPKKEVRNPRSGGSGKGPKTPTTIDESLGFLRNKSSIIYPESQNRVVEGSIFQRLPDGPMARVWNYKGKRLISSRSKINESFELAEERGQTLTYYIFSLPEMTLTSRKELKGIFNLFELPKISLQEANEWLGVGEIDNWQLSGGECVLSTSPNGEITVLKPKAKVWREALAFADSHPDSFLLGAVLFRDYQRELYSRFIDLIVVGNMEPSEYAQHWVLLNQEIEEPYQRISNTYFNFIQSLNTNLGKDFYSRFFGTEPLVDFVPQIFNLKEISAEDKRENRSDYIKLIYRIWEEINSKDYLTGILAQIRRATFNKPESPWENFLQLFIFEKESLNGIQINKLRKRFNIGRDASDSQ